jgi:hypothetical protein
MVTGQVRSRPSEDAAVPKSSKAMRICRSRSDWMAASASGVEHGGLGDLDGEAVRGEAGVGERGDHVADVVAGNGGDADVERGGQPPVRVAAGPYPRPVGRSGGARLLARAR